MIDYINIHAQTPYLKTSADNQVGKEALVNNACCNLCGNNQWRKQYKNVKAKTRLEDEDQDQTCKTDTKTKTKCIRPKPVKQQPKCTTEKNNLLQKTLSMKWWPVKCGTVSVLIALVANKDI